MAKPEPYRPPVDQLLTIGEPAKCGVSSLDDWPDYPTTLGLTAADVPELIRMAVDKQWDHACQDLPSIWASLHARRALGQLRAAEAIQPLLKSLNHLDKIDDDAGLEEMPLVLGLIGPPAVEWAGLFLENATNEMYARAAAGDALMRIGQRFPDSRAACVVNLCRTLAKARWNDPGINGLIIANLVELKAVESADVIRQAFLDDYVDESIVGDWQDVSAELGVALPKGPLESPRAASDIRRR
ncbi:MAG: hypothetical protein IT443_02320 [Phycisphaeraceae bacterium]|nr:hypothetical protein [Phycisphaeraceae bacterium]